MTGSIPHIGALTGPKAWIRPDGFDRVPPHVVDEARGLASASVHEAAGRIGALPSAIKPVHPRFTVCGPTLTVYGPGGDNLWLHYAIYAARPGDVIVAHCSGVFDHGYWGEVMSTAARARGLGGLVIDGCVRDLALLGEVGFPVFARGTCIRGTAKDRAASGWINAPTRFGDVSVAPGDLVIGDQDGVVAVPAARAQAAIAAARRRDEDELAICQRLEQGESTIDIYQLG